MPCFRYRRLPVACASKSPRRCSASGAGNAYLYLTTFGRREQEAKINKKRTRFLWRNGDGNGKDDGTDRKHFRAGHTGSAENHPAIPAEHHKISAGTGNRSGGEVKDRILSRRYSQRLQLLRLWYALQNAHELRCSFAGGICCRQELPIRHVNFD